MTTTTLDDLTEGDRAALQLALDLTLAGDPEGPVRAKQVRGMLQGDGPYLPPRPWREVAEFCSYCQQHERLGILFGEAPCEIDEADIEAIVKAGPKPAVDGSGIDISNYPSALMLKRMLAYGVSRYHPNPLAAIEAATKAKRRPR